AVFRAIERELGPLNVVAEDLGVITEPVVRLRRELGFPGMVVLQFGLVESEEEQSVIYTGTHDNDTAVGWWQSLDEAARERSGLDPADPAWSLIEFAWRSRSALAIAPLQDVLALGNEARMNLPGTERGNWDWRYKPRALTDANAARLRRLTSSSSR